MLVTNDNGYAQTSNASFSHFNFYMTHKLWMDLIKELLDIS